MLKVKWIVAPTEGCKKAFVGYGGLWQVFVGVTGASYYLIYHQRVSNLAFLTFILFTIY
jgi:hypothetical protein